MTPVTLTIDRQFRGVGRIKRATGTTNPAIARKMSRMLTTLADEQRLDILRAIRDKRIDLPTVYAAFQRKALHELPLGDTAKTLPDAMRAWIADAGYSAKHAGSLETSVRYLERANPKAAVADLPALLESLRTTLGRTHPRSYNLVRAAALAFVRATLKRSHPLWLAIAAVEPRKVTAQRKPHPLTPDQLRDLFPNPETDAVDAVAWGMATTGMGQAEYWGRWHVKADRVHIEGTKRAGRVRDVPLVVTPKPPTMHRRTFENALRDRSRTFTVYDLRRTYANWLESAGIPRTRRMRYLGHGATDVTALYERHEVEAYLAEDGAKLRTHCGVASPVALGLVKGAKA